MSNPEAVYRKMVEAIFDTIDAAKEELETVDPKGEFNLQVVCEIALASRSKSTPTPVGVILHGMRAKLVESEARLALGSQSCEPALESDCGNPSCDFIDLSFETVLDDGREHGAPFSLN